MGKKTIAVDVDDVLAASAEGFVAWSNEKFDTNLTVEDYQEHWAQMWGVDHEETQRRAHIYYASDAQRTFAPFDAAYDTLRALSEHFRLVILTSRRISARELTTEWLEEHYAGVFEDAIYSGFYDTLTEHSFSLTKGDLAKQAGVDFLIDDQLKHVSAAAQHGIPGLLFGEYPWNRAEELPPLVTRAHDWNAVRAYFDALASPE